MRLKFLYGISLKDVDDKIEIYNNIFLSTFNGNFEIPNKRNERESVCSETTLNESSSNFKSYVDEEGLSGESKFKSYIEETEEQKKMNAERIALLKIRNKKLATMEQATPPMNQVKSKLFCLRILNYKKIHRFWQIKGRVYWILEDCLQFIHR